MVRKYCCIRSYLQLRAEAQGLSSHNDMLRANEWVNTGTNCIEIVARMSEVTADGCGE